MSNLDVPRNATVGDLRRSGAWLVVGCSHCGIEYRVDPKGVTIHGRSRVSEVYHRFRCRSCGRPAGYTQAEAAAEDVAAEPAA